MPAKRSPESSPPSAGNPFAPYDNGRASIDTSDIGPLFQQYHQPLARFAFRHLSMRHLSVDDADDVVQETFLKLHERLSSQDPTLQPVHTGKAVVTYLCHSVTNRITDRFRQQRNGLKHGDYSQTSVEDEEAHLIPDPDPTPEEVAIINERRRLMRTALLNLGQRKAQMLFAADFEGGRNTEELAAQFTESNKPRAKMLLMRARNEFESEYASLLRSSGDEDEIRNLSERGKRTTRGNIPRRGRATGS